MLGVTITVRYGQAQNGQKHKTFYLEINNLRFNKKKRVNEHVMVTKNLYQITPTINLL